MTDLRAITSRLVIVVALMLAMASSAVAHRLAMPAPDPAAEAFLMAGGSWADVCGDAAPLHEVYELCETCRLVEDIALSDLQHGAIFTLSLQQVITSNLTACNDDGPYWDPGVQVRAPPAA
ncbi:MAG: hypothetical protein AAGG57_01390 [Pseudomonadota bacterium]